MLCAAISQAWLIWVIVYSGLVSPSGFLADVPGTTATRSACPGFPGLWWPKDQGARKYGLDLDLENKGR